MLTRVQKDRYNQRIISIIKSHLLIFGTDLLDFNLGPLPMYHDLLTFNENAPRDIVQRVLSILRANEALYNEGILVRKKKNSKEFLELERYILTLLKIEEKELARANIIPQTLGMSFLRKRLGVPLFGYHRPPKAPHIPGILVCYQSMAADGIGRIEILLLDSTSKIRYKELGIEMDSECQSLHCIISEHNELNYPGTLIPKSAFTDKKTSRYVFDTKTVVLSGTKKKFKIKNKSFDPLHYQYAYFFIADDLLKSKLTRFLLDLFLGSFGFRKRDIEPIVADIIQRAL